MIYKILAGLMLITLGGLVIIWQIKYPANKVYDLYFLEDFRYILGGTFAIIIGIIMVIDGIND